jgi:tungstate transport system ATP-binding protein
MKIKSGEIQALLGPNGVGKTVFNRLLSLIIQPESGEIRWDGQVVSPISNGKNVETIRKIGYLWQHPVFISSNLRKNIEYPLLLRDIPKEQRKKLVDDQIKEFRLGEYQYKKPNQLSIGTLQRAALARTLITKPQLVILDEPAASLDMATIKWLEQYLKDYSREVKPVIIWTTHDQFQARRIAKIVNILMDGIVESGDMQTLEEKGSAKVRNYLQGKLVV